MTVGSDRRKWDRLPTGGPVGSIDYDTMSKNIE